jgi:hypothetical protein
MLDNVYTPSPLPPPATNIHFHLPLFGGLVPPRPTVTMLRESITPKEMPKPRRIKIERTKRCFVFGAIWDKGSWTLYILIPMLLIEISLNKTSERYFEGG